jgi:flavorubredoxin
MARTAITLRNLTANGGIAAPSADNIDQSNGMSLAIPTSAIPAAPDMENLILVVTNSAGSAKNVIVRAGVGGGATPGPAFRSGLGDLTVSVASSGTSYIGPLESARFSQLDNSLLVDFGSGATGTITALLVPKNFG